MGSDPIALPMLEAHFGRAGGAVSLVGVFTQPDRPRGRGHQVRGNAIKEWAGERAIPVYQPERCDEAAIGRLAQMRPDLVLVMAFGQLLPKAMLEMLPGGFLNLHASRLPRLRGASPIQTAIATGLEETAVSLMRMVPRMDAGPVADIEPVAIAEDATVATLSAALGQACVPLMGRAFAAIGAGGLVFTEQDPDRVTYCRILSKEDAHLDFAVSAQQLERRIRALNPWPGPRFLYGGQELRVHEARGLSGHCGEVPGTILESGPRSLVVACGSGCLDIRALQRPGGRVLPTEAFLRGHPMECGEILESRPMVPLESATR